MAAEIVVWLFLVDRKKQQLDKVYVATISVDKGTGREVVVVVIG